MAGELEWSIPPFANLSAHFSVPHVESRPQCVSEEHDVVKIETVGKTFMAAGTLGRTSSCLGREVTEGPIWKFILQKELSDVFLVAWEAPWLLHLSFEMPAFEQNREIMLGFLKLVDPFFGALKANPGHQAKANSADKGSNVFSVVGWFIFYQVRNSSFGACVTCQIRSGGTAS